MLWNYYSLDLAWCFEHWKFRLWIMDFPHCKKIYCIIWSIAVRGKRTQNPNNFSEGHNWEVLWWSWNAKWNLSQENRLLVWWLPLGSLWLTSTDRIWKEVWEKSWRLVWTSCGGSHFKVKCLTIFHLMAEVLRLSDTDFCSVYMSLELLKFNYVRIFIKELLFAPLCISSYISFTDSFLHLLTGIDV